MSDIDLREIISNDIAIPDDINQLISALINAQYPRAIDGKVSNESGSMGDSLRRFLEGHFKDIFATSINVGTINEFVGLTATSVPFFASGSFIVPSGVKKILISAIGGGGAGGASESAIASGGGGGGNGASILFSIPTEDADEFNIGISAGDVTISRIRASILSLIATASAGKSGSYGSDTDSLVGGGRGGEAIINNSDFLGMTIQYKIDGAMGGYGNAWTKSIQGNVSDNLFAGAGGSRGVAGTAGNTNGFIPASATITYWS